MKTHPLKRPFCYWLVSLAIAAVMSLVVVLLATALTTSQKQVHQVHSDDQQTNAPELEQQSLMIHAHVQTSALGIFWTSADRQEAQVCLKDSFDSTYSMQSMSSTDKQKPLYMTLSTPSSWSLSHLDIADPLQDDHDWTFLGVAARRADERNITEVESDWHHHKYCEVCPLKKTAVDDLSNDDLNRELQHRLWEETFCTCLNQEEEPMPTFAGDFVQCRMQVQQSSSIEHPEDKQQHASVMVTWNNQLTATTSSSGDVEENFTNLMTARERNTAQLCLRESFLESFHYVFGTEEEWQLQSVHVSQEFHSLATGVDKSPPEQAQVVLRGAQESITATTSTTTTTALKLHVVANQTVETNEGNIFEFPGRATLSPCPVLCPGSATTTNLSLRDLLSLKRHRSWEQSFCSCFHENNGGIDLSECHLTVSGA